MAKWSWAFELQSNNVKIEIAALHEEIGNTSLLTKGFIQIFAMEGE